VKDRGLGARPRAKWPFVLIALGVVAVVAGAWTAVTVHNRDVAARKNRQQAQAALSSYLSAWSHGNDAALTAVSTPAAGVVPAIDALRHDLDVRSASYVPGALTVHGSRASAPYTAMLVMQGLGTYSYAGTLALQKSGGQWKVVPDLASVHPALQPDTHLARIRALGARGRLLAGDGSLLKGADAELDSNLLGSVGPLTTAAQAAAIGPQFQVGDVAGLSGLERAYNKQLAGLPGGSVVVADAHGKTVKVLKKYSAQDGTDVKTTIDLRVQQAGESALAGVSKPAALVAIDTRTGAMIAEVNNPLAGYSRSLRGVYPPGSTFKVITATAGLMAGRTPQTVLQCPPNVTVDGRNFGNAEGEQYGPISFQTAFERSCNTAFINLERSLPQSVMTQAAKLYGFDGTEPLPIKSTGGSYPQPNDGAEAAAQAFGQGRDTASPLQMASVAAAVASGTWRQPFVVGSTKVSHPLPANVAATLRTFMTGVVTSGTAAGAGLPAGTAGKTGTAEFGNAPPGGHPPTHAWFIGYRGPVAFAVVVEGGGFGGEVAAPIAANFLNHLG
jgi:hypothetical protein